MEIPAWFSNSTQFLEGPGVKGMRRVVPDMNLSSHRKIYVEIGFAEFFDLHGAAWFLTPEVVGRHAKHDQALITVARPNVLQAPCCGVKPQLEAVFTTRTALPADRDRGKSPPSIA